MKKLSLLFFAFLVSICTMRAENVALNASISIDGEAVSFYTIDNPQTTETVNQSNMSIFVDGDKDNNYRFAGYTNSTDTGNSFTFIGQTFIIDLGAEKNNLDYIKVYFTNALAESYKIEYSTDNSTWTEWVDITNNNNMTVSHKLNQPVSARYIKFIPRQASVWNYGVAIKEIEVYTSENATLSTVTATIANTNLRVNDTSQITANAYDQFGDNFNATFTYSSSDSSVATVSEEGLITAVSVGNATITVTAENKNASINVNVLPLTTTPGAKAEVKYPDSDILKVYTADYTNGENGSGWGKGSHTATWTEKSTYSVEGSTVLHITGNGYSARTENSATATNFKTAYVAVFPTTGGTLYVFDDETNNANPFKTVIAGEWNYVKLPINFTTNYVGFSIAGETELYVGYIVLSTETNTQQPFVVGSEDANGIVPVAGTINSENVVTVEAITGKVIDLRNATLGDNVTGFTLNTNQLIIAKAEAASNQDQQSAMAEALTGNTNNVIVTDGTYYWAMKPIVYTDENAHQPVSFSINTLQQGYTITRSIPSGSYVTAAPMAAVTAPDGVDVYEFTAYTAGTVTFTKKAGGAMTAKNPYVLRNTTGGVINLVVSGTGNLNPTVDAITITYNNANFVANLQEITTSANDDPAKYILSGGQIKKGAGVKIGAFRAYFTGISAAANGARALFIDDESTKVGTITADGEIEVGDVYNLSGQRVTNPRKGLYIVNGKKVVMK